MRSKRLDVVRRRATPQLLEPGRWPRRTGGARVLVEHPDGAVRWSTAAVLREAGYDVAVCPGPGGDRCGEAQCPLLARGRCSLAAEADVVVASTMLSQSRELVAAHASSASPALVVEAPRLVVEREGYEVGAAPLVELLTHDRLLDAVEGALDAA